MSGSAAYMDIHSPHYTRYEARRWNRVRARSERQSHFETAGLVIKALLLALDKIKRHTQIAQYMPCKTEQSRAHNNGYGMIQEVASKRQLWQWNKNKCGRRGRSAKDRRDNVRLPPCSCGRHGWRREAVADWGMGTRGVECTGGYTWTFPRTSSLGGPGLPR
jgi:hypothetical protein